MKAKSDPRHTARKLALSQIFCWLFTEGNDKECLVLSQDLLEDSQYDQELDEYIVEGVKNNISKIDQIIETCAPEWPIDKIAKIDLVILRIAVFEILFGKKAPVKVAIDEAVEIAKEFGNDTSHKFVNGVLGTVVESYIEKKNNE